MYLVTNNGFVKSLPIDVIDMEQMPENTGDQSVSIYPSQFLDSQVEHLLSFDRVVIEFESFSDGRGFSLAKLFRQSGYIGKIRARGNMFCEQYRYLLDCGFDEIEITLEQALRQPFEHWQSNKTSSYRDRLKNIC